MKKFLILLSAAVLCCILLASCNGGAGTDTEADTSAPETEAAKISIIADGLSEYVIVRPDTSADDVTSASMSVRDKINEIAGIRLTLKTDLIVPNNASFSATDYEILVGNTNRDETAQAMSELGYLDYGIFVKGTKICIVGGSDPATVDAVGYFIDTFVTGASLEIDADYSYICRAEYPTPDAAIDGVPLTDYTIVYGTGYSSTASTLAERLGKSTGAILSVTKDSSDRQEHEIVIYSQKRDTLRTFDSTEDYSITCRDGSIYIDGGSKAAVGAAMSELAGLIAAGNSTSASLCVTYNLPDRSEYINDISKLSMRWAGEFEPADWITDFDEKYAAMQDPDGRMMSCIHRGDSIYYPENSIEGYISCILMGADMIEIDPRLTKDGVLVLMHDATLTRTTDFSEKAGKNGLPTSANLCDWTYDQLMQLNLKENNGGTSAKVTQFKIPTLDEAMQVCANRIFIRLDVKGPETGVYYWDYEKDIWPLEQKYNSYNSVIFTWHAVFYRNNYALVKKYKALQEAACGRSAVYFIGCSASTVAKTVLNTIKSNKFDPVVRLTDYDWDTYTCDEYIANISDKLEAFKGNARLYIDAQKNGTRMQETPAYWDKLQAAGINILLVNESVSFVKYIQENYSPAEK